MATLSATLDGLTGPSTPFYVPHKTAFVSVVVCTKYEIEDAHAIIKY